MQHDKQPKYGDINVKCSCGHEFTTGSVLGQDLKIEVCSACHPFYTGKQKVIDNAGRVSGFRKAYGEFSLLSGGAKDEAEAAK